MGVAHQLRRWLRREGVDAREAWEDLRRRGDAHLDRKERELHETPEEGVTRLQEEIRANDEAFKALRGRLGQSRSGPDRASDRPGPDRPGPEPHGPGRPGPEPHGPKG